MPIPVISKRLISGRRSRSSKTSNGNEKVGGICSFLKVTFTRELVHFCIEYLIRSVSLGLGICRGDCCPSCDDDEGGCLAGADNRLVPFGCPLVALGFFVSSSGLEKTMNSPRKAEELIAATRFSIKL